MGDRDDKPGWVDREKLSFSELDRRRRERRDSHDPAPRGEKAQQRASAATKQYLDKIGEIFASGSGGAEGERLARAMRDAHGTPQLAAACRAYRDAIGMPADAKLLSLFLDARDEELVVAALEAVATGVASGRVELTSGLRGQVRLLAQDSSDAVAEAAEDALEAL